MVSVTDKILERIRSKGEGWAFTAKDFLDIANRASVDKGLSTAYKAEVSPPFEDRVRTHAHRTSSLQRSNCIVKHSLIMTNDKT